MSTAIEKLNERIDVLEEKIKLLSEVLLKYDYSLGMLNYVERESLKEKMFL